MADAVYHDGAKLITKTILNRQGLQTAILRAFVSDALWVYFLPSVYGKVESCYVLTPPVMPLVGTDGAK